MYIFLKTLFYHVLPQVMTHINLGRSTALVCDSGDLYTKVVSVHDGYCLNKSSKCVPLGGSTLSGKIK